MFRRLRVRPAQRVCLVLALLVVPAGRLLGQETRTAVPEESSLEQARRLAEELYGEELRSATTPEQLQALAGRLLREAGQAGDDPSSRFVMLELAADVAVRAGDGRSALDTIDQITEKYDADAVGMKLELLSELADAARSRVQQKALAVRTMPVVAEAVRRDDYQSAARLGQIALTAAQRARDGTLVKRIVAANTRVQQAGRDYAEVEAACRILQASPTDAAANLRVGRYLCLVKGDWEAGTAMLALGNDPETAGPAIADLKGPDSAAAQVELADRWWRLAEDAEDVEKTNLMIRAGHWYRQALAGLSGLAKTKVEIRLEEVPDRVASSLDIPTPWVKIINGNSALCLSVKGASKESGAVICQYSRDESAKEQQWEVIPLDPEWCALLNRQSGQLLGVPGGSTAAGVTLTQSPPDRSSQAQHWRFAPAAPQWFGILSRHSGQAVAVAYGSKEPGGTICQWPYSKDWKQHQWRIEPVVY